MHTFLPNGVIQPYSIALPGTGDMRSKKWGTSLVSNTGYWWNAFSARREEAAGAVEFRGTPGTVAWLPCEFRGSKA
jgi:hypothetical protein